MFQNNTITLTTAYLGPISYFKEIYRANNISIEQYDSYHKQTYRNRCRILLANNVIDLTVPVIKNKGCKTLLKDVEIDYSTRWQQIHWRSIVSAYNSSPFFEYYRNSFEHFYSDKYRFLIDLNMDMQNEILKILEWEKNVALTTDYQHTIETGKDMREKFTPKKETPIDTKNLDYIPYTQTFCGKDNFVPNLSIIDALFNLGSETYSIMK